ncbi:LamG-like jellyroll fold domain-containing protein [Sphingomonas glacialis]|uniref:LamG-like jellyroll fold domain-containing protein n=1 Tax=Sphingomonas glacialis TaxID=658225 RepID=UPI0013872B75|nr:LamG-like jellyroll fold domain-containing protein [Sphingomonas glacialis]
MVKKSSEWKCALRIARASTLAAGLLAANAASAGEQRPILDLTFDSPATESEFRIETQFSQPDFTSGVRGRGWRSDGFSSAVIAPLTLAPNRGFTIETWVALESNPSDAEVPVASLKPASFLNQATAKAGFDLFIDMYGRWGLRISTTRGNKRVVASAPFPLGRWAHLAATFDPAVGVARLFLDGKSVGEVATGVGKPFLVAPRDLRIARSWQDATMGIFSVNGLNAAFDDVRVFDRTLSREDILKQAETVPASDAAASLAVPASRFAGDIQRPLYHAMPSANWTNEPHGLIRRNDGWHMFYQRTPNGPYKTEMHWGHMVSRDLVKWRYMPDALWPTLQTDTFGFDMKGIWSGDVVTGPKGVAYAFYTSVNNSPDLFNPGISVALSADPDLRTWQKRGPIINAAGLRDFRDPYVWQQDGEWRMIVGAALPEKGGGVAYYRCADIDDIKGWKKQPRIAPFEKMDIGSDIWEMPVFQPIGQGKYILLANPIGGAVSKYGDPTTRAVYWIGAWDGKAFTPEQFAPKFLDLIPGHLSPTVDRDAAGNLVGIGIVDERRSTEAQKQAGWAHTFSLPREWRLLGDGKTLGQAPLSKLAALRDSARTLEGAVEGLVGDQMIGDLGASAEYKVDFGDKTSSSPIGLILATSPDGAESTQVIYDPATRKLTLDKRKSSLSGTSEGPMLLTGAYDEVAFGRPRSFHVFVDHSVVDVFINDAAAFSFRLYPSRADSTKFGVIGSQNGPVRYQGWRLRAAKFSSDVGERSTGSP